MSCFWGRHSTLTGPLSNAGHKMGTTGKLSEKANEMPRSKML